MIVYIYTEQVSLHFDIYIVLNNGLVSRTVSDSIFSAFRLSRSKTAFIMHSAALLSALAAVPAAMACLGYEGGLPTPTGTKTLSEPYYIGAGETFDAGWVKYDRGVACGGQSEGGKD